MKFLNYALLLPLFFSVPNSQGASSPIDPNIFVNLSKKMIPSVVNISTTTRGEKKFGRGGPGQEDMFRKFFEDFFRNPGGGRGRVIDPEDEGGSGSRPLSLGTGFIIESSGLILTNNHVVAGADEIKIHFTEDEDEKPTDGHVVGRDPELDLALIQVKTKRELIPAALGDSDALQVGEYVMAVGNPFGQGHSVTHGIISAKGRKSPDFQLANYIQTDAPINPGNSGGPLVNLKGEVIGINNAIDQRAQGIGFAIPINLAKQVLTQLKTKGTVSRGYIGVQVNDLTPEIANRIGAPKELRACFVAHIYSGGPADKAGMKPYDIITELNGKKISTSNELIATVTSVAVDETVKTKVLRNGKEVELQIKIGLRPSQPGAAPSKPPLTEEKKGARDKSGIDVEELTPETARELGVTEKLKGVVVSDLKYEGPGDKAGLMRGDIIVEVDRKKVTGIDQFYTLIKAKKSYLLRVRRAEASGDETFQVLVLDLK